MDATYLFELVSISEIAGVNVQYLQVHSMNKKSIMNLALCNRSFGDIRGKLTHPASIEVEVTNTREEKDKSRGFHHR
jgi:hypothetical protein